MNSGEYVPGLTAGLTKTYVLNLKADLTKSIIRLESRHILRGLTADGQPHGRSKL